jgi:hypothetical protein
MASLTIVTLYERFSQAEAAIRDLVSTGVPSREIGILAHNPRSEPIVEKTHKLCRGARFVRLSETGPAIAACAVLDLIERTPDRFTQALEEVGVPTAHAEIYADGVQCGGTLVTVRANDGGIEPVMAALGRHEPIDITSRSARTRERAKPVLLKKPPLRH